MQVAAGGAAVTPAAPLDVTSIAIKGASVINPTHWWINCLKGARLLAPEPHRS